MCVYVCVSSAFTVYGIWRSFRKIWIEWVRECVSSVYGLFPMSRSANKCSSYVNVTSNSTSHKSTHIHIHVYTDMYILTRFWVVPHQSHVNTHVHMYVYIQVTYLLTRFWVVPHQSHVASWPPGISTWTPVRIACLHVLRCCMYVCMYVCNCMCVRVCFYFMCVVLRVCMYVCM